MVAKKGINPTFHRYLVIFLIALAGGLITKLPYIGDVYFVPLEAATGATRTQMGLLWSAYGLINFITYFPGGILADKFSAKKLVVFSCWATAAIGVWYWTLPSFTWLIAIHMMFAMTTVFTFWAAMQKTVNNLGGKDEQGKMFGFLEGTRSTVSMVVVFGSVFIFDLMANDVAGFKGVILYYSILLGIIGFLVLIFLQEGDKTTTTTQEKPKMKKAEVIALLKYPQVWLCGLVAFCSYGSNCFASYINPYFVETFGASTTTAALMTTLRSTVMSVIGAYLAGYLADKFGSRVGYMRIGFVGMTIFSAALLVIPATQVGQYLFFGCVVFLGFFAYSVKSLYFATMQDVGIPNRLAGTASGIVSIVGYAPEMFIYIIIGQIMDNLGNALGYKINFASMVGVAILGIVSSTILLSMIKKNEGGLASKIDKLEQV